jgi:hypothetical protein
MKNKNSTHQVDDERFGGFEPLPQSWDFPTVIDGWVDKLTGSEFKCLWYILRHTYGWQKTADAISLTQFERGVYLARQKRWLDRGTGLSRQGVLNALDGLEQKGFIRKVSIRSSHGDMDANTYEVVKKETVAGEVVKKLDHRSQKIPPQVVKKFDPQSLTIETIYNQTSKDFNEISRSSKSFGPSGNHSDKTYTTARGHAQDDSQNSQELTERESWLLEEITDWVGVDTNTGFYKKVISRLGEDVSREEFREAVYRDKTGEVIDRAKYLGRLLSKRLKDFEERQQEKKEGLRS